ncbi:winged helix-turn-helix domain-containing protein [Mesorhizobium sp.]|uniref:winged helix-turn-helix domain-containing protein n=1 Tax=Mesorhizobium sp. TaxID=1871066 RepID=UPI0025E6C29C|nr:winged helix-turn-helix domain-containing protein [Mesorhizobium sp.]
MREADHSERAVIRLGACAFDRERGLLLNNGRPVDVRARTFSLLVFLLEHANRVVSRDEIFEVVWKGLVVTDDALTQTVRDLRNVLGDEGAALIKTVAKRGYMLTLQSQDEAKGHGSDAGSTEPQALRRAFELLVDESRSTVPLVGSARSAEAQSARASGRDRPAVAVLPFALEDIASSNLHVLRDGLLRDIIRDLARLRTVFVIAANSLQALSFVGLDRLEAARLLRCDYVCAGNITLDGPTLRVDVELIADDGGHVLFSETFSKPLASISQFGQTLADEIAALIADEVNLAERNIAVRRPLHELDAWQAYHRGLGHMHMFTGQDNTVAEDLFKAAIDLDPRFARPYASLSFTHWLRAYLLDPAHLSEEGRLAYDLAARAVAIDPYDPAAHSALGRALWIIGARDEAVEALERATALSPSYAFGHYARAFIEAFSGNARIGIEASDRARELSPFDPFLTANQAARALALLRLGKAEEAAAWAMRAMHHPNAHAHMRRIAALSLAAAGRIDEAKLLARQVNGESPENGNDLFIRANRMPPGDEKLLRDLSRQSGLL